MTYILIGVLAVGFIGALIVIDRTDKRSTFERAALQGRYIVLLRQAQDDVRALTEALVRAEGKPMVFPRRAPLQQSPGWYDKRESTGPKPGRPDKP